MHFLRPTLHTDQLALLALARETGVFKPLEIDALEEVLNDYHSANQAQGHRSITCEDSGEPLGFAYYAPAAMTDRTWHLYWIAVAKQLQGRGIGGTLLKFAEDDIRQRQGRILLIETSSLEHYEPTRRFYLKQQYEEAAIVPDYYADGDSMVIYRKRLAQCTNLRRASSAAS